MKIIFNHDVSIKALLVGEYIQQGNSGVDHIEVGVDGYDNESVVVSAIFTLPNGDTNTLSATPSNVEFDNATYNGWKITLTQAQTLYFGELLMSLRVTDLQDRVLFTYRTSLTINKTPFVPDEQKISESQWNSLQQTLASLQVKYGEGNVRKYETLDLALADLNNLANGQLVLVKVGDYYQHKIKSGGSLTDVKTQQAAQITIGGIYNSKEDLPTPSEEKSGKIYLVRATTKTTANAYNEYITIYDGDSYQWEQAGVNVDDLYPSFSILRTLPNVNINGKSLGSIWSAPFTSGDNPYFTIKYDNRNINKEGAIGWLRFATGIETLPTFSLDSPKQVYITFVAQQDYGNPVVVYNGDLVITKVQWEQSGDEYGQLKLYIVKTIGSRYHDLTILGSGTYGGITLKSGNGHDIDIVNNETENKIAIYRANQSRLICFDEIAPNTNDIISLGVYDSETPTNNKGYKNVVSNNFVLGSEWLIKKDASGNYTIQSLYNEQELFKLTSSGYVYTRGVVPVSNKNRPLGGDGAEFQELWTPTLKTKDGTITYEKSVKDLMTSDETYTKAEVDSLIEGVTHKYQHNVVFTKGSNSETRIYFSFIDSNSTALNNTNAMGLIPQNRDIMASGGYNMGTDSSKGYSVIAVKRINEFTINNFRINNFSAVCVPNDTTLGAITEIVSGAILTTDTTITDTVVQIC